MASPHDPGRTRRRQAAIAVAALGLLVAVAGAIVTLAAFGSLRDAHAQQAEARVTYGNVELIVQARRDDALDQPSLASTSTDDDHLDEELDALAAGRPSARADIEELRTRERAMRDATEEAVRTDERLLSGTVSSLEQVRRTAVRPFAAEVDAAEQRVRRSVLATAALSAAAWLATLALRRADRT